MLRRYALLSIFVCLLCGRTEAQTLTLGIDTRGVDAQVAQSAALGPPPQEAQPQAQGQAQEKGRRVSKKEIEDYSEQEAVKIADARAKRLSLLVNPAQPGLWNVGPYLGVMTATLGQCSLKEGCSATVQDDLRKPSGWTALGLELRVTPLAPLRIDILQLAGRIGVDLLNGQIAGLSSGAAMSWSGEARLVLLGIAGVGVGYAGQMTSWGVQGAGGGAEQRSATQHYGLFSAGVSLRGVTLTGECKVGSWAGFNLDRGEFGSIAGYCGTVLSAMVY